MQTLTIKVINAKALKLLEDLEALNLIQVIKKSVAGDNTKKLSERLAGSITPEQAELMRKELNQTRSEWDRNI